MIHRYYFGESLDFQLTRLGLCSEVCGEAGAGKTQMLLQVTAHARRSYLASKQQEEDSGETRIVLQVTVLHILLSLSRICDNACLPQDLGQERKGGKARRGIRLQGSWWTEQKTESPSRTWDKFMMHRLFCRCSYECSCPWRMEGWARRR